MPRKTIIADSWREEEEAARAANVYPEEERGDADEANYSYAEQEPEPPQNGRPHGPQLKFMTSAEFAAADFKMKWLIRQIFVAGQPGLIGGPKKALKTTNLVDLALSLGTGMPFLGTFAVPRPVRVAMISGESGQATLQETARRIAAAKGIDLANADVLWEFQLPQLGNALHLAALQEALQEAKAEVLIYDPLYLGLLGGIDRGASMASNLFGMGPLLLGVASACLSIGCTPILAHHFKLTRSNHYAEPELEDLAFSGVQEFCRQWVLLGRRAKYMPGTGQHLLWLSVGGSAGHSGLWHLDIDEGVIDEDFRGRKWEVSVLTASEGRQVERDVRGAAKKQEKARQEQEDDNATLAALDRLTSRGNPGSDNAVRVESGLSRPRAERAVGRLLDEDIVQRIEVETFTGTGLKTKKQVPGLRRKPTE